MYYVLLSGYNNYYNRIYKRENTIQGYIDASSEYVVFQDGMNFEYRDGISTEKLFNTGEFTGEPNYLLLKQNATDTTPLSRWFVVEWVRVRGNQYRAILRRDLLADNYDAIMESPCFIEKGWVPNTDPAVFNKENITVNQIKKKEWPIKDDTDIAWLVGYLATDHATLTDREFAIDADVDYKMTGNFSDWQYADWCTGTKTSVDMNLSYFRFYLRGRQYDNLIGIYQFNWNVGEHNIVDNIVSTYRNYWWLEPKGAIEEIQDTNWWNAYTESGIENAIIADNSGWVKKSTIQDFYTTYNGKKIQFDDGVYQITVTSYSELDNDYSSDETNTNLFTYFRDNMSSKLSTVITDGRIDSTSDKPLSKRLHRTVYTIRAERVQNVEGTYKYSITASARKLNDAPYKMIAIPYKTTQVPYTMDGIALDKDLALAWAMDIAKNLGGAQQGTSGCYDFQILPFMPDIKQLFNMTFEMQAGVGLVSVSWSWDSSATVQENIDYIYLKTGTTNKCIAFMCPYSSWSFSTFAYSGDVSGGTPSIYNFKESNELDVYRLCSPNYSSVFEFSPSKNGGNYSRYNVYCTYKPYQPFIYVAPQYQSLYGEDFKDNRGLILSGDFSLPIVSDTWTNYQLQNKNYQLAFDRQIEHMNVEYGWQRAQGIANAVAGTAQGTTTGMVAGGMAGGVPGAVAGAVLGTAGAVGGGIADLEMQKALHNEAIDYAKDQFGYQLGNIKALPNTLNKVSSLVATSKIFPYVEYYTCTDAEREAFRDKIKYNGMSIGRIGHILDFKSPSDTTYIKGQIIRLKGEFDTHTANEIANEFMKGWYI